MLRALLISLAISGAVLARCSVASAAFGDLLGKLVASDGQEDDYFGGNVAIHGNVALVGAPGAHNENGTTGAAYLFDLETKSQLAILSPSINHFTYRFSQSIAIGEDIAMVWGTRAYSVWDAQSGELLHERNGYASSADIAGDVAILGLRTCFEIA